jgi:hypothetical protein
LVIVAVGWPLINLLVTMEMYINDLLHIRQTDFVRGYFAFFIPSIGFSLCLWALLRLSSGSKLAKVVLHSIAGPLILLAIPAYWQYLAWTSNLWGWYGSRNWRYGASPFEALVALAIALIYLRGKWPAPWWTLTPFLAMHFFFWALPVHEIAFGPSVLLGPLVLVGFCASWVWVAYVANRRRTTEVPA